MIRLEGLHRRFGPRVAVERIDLVVERGELLALLGPNGAGKTTTLRMLTGFLEPTSGRARVLGHVVADDPLPVRRRLGYLPEGAPLWPETTPRDLLAFCARVRRLETARWRRAQDHLVEALQLGEAMRRRIDTLSRGLRRRVALAAALLHDPEVIVLDEPTAGLDPNQKHAVRTLLRELATDRVVILSTHLLEEVEALCTRAAVMHRGRVVADASPRALRRRSRWEGAVTVRFAGIAPTPAALTALPGVESVSGPAADSAFTLFPTPGDDSGALLQASLLELARGSRSEVAELRVHEGRLDEVFGRLTDRADPS
ncbi:MAG: ABC transporter ATP-binding protein [Pseudomonadales bacterium]|jgi:ABC-2 type transport system ATP-binding protein|nr:ABC transporter ATP-binding protein [Pseudomonadales bacterium]